MGTLDNILAGGSQPGPAPGTGTLDSILASPKSPPPEPAPISGAGAFAINATNVFGAAPVISGLLAKIQGQDYTAARDEYQAQIDAAKEQHPYLSGAGSVASLVPETVLGGGVGKLVGAGAKAAGLASAPFIESNPIFSKILEGAGTGAAYGAASSAGSAASHGKDVLPAAEEGAALGGAFGGAVGGVTGKIGQMLDSGIAKQNESLIRGAAEKALPKKQNALANLIETDDDLAGVAKKAKISVSDVLQENRDLLKDLRGQDYDQISQARQAISDKVKSLEPAKALDYANVDHALGGGVDAGDLIESLKNKAARVTERPYRKVLLTKADQLTEDYGSVSTDEARKALLTQAAKGEDPAVAQLRKLVDNPNTSDLTRNAAKEQLASLAPDANTDAVTKFAESLPEGKQWTAKDFLNHSVGSTKSADFNPDIRKAVESLPFEFDAKLKIPSQEIRSLLTSSQEEAESALGTLNATKNAKLAAQNQQVIGSVMDKALQAAKKTKLEGIGDSVQQIYDTNLRQSVLLKLNEAAAPKEDKLKLGKLGLGAKIGHTASSFLAGNELLGAGRHLLNADPVGALKDVGLAIAAKAAPKAIAVAQTGSIDAAAAGQRALLKLQQAASQGNPRAIALLKSIRNAKTLGTAGAGVVGGVTSSTLGQQ